MGNHLVNRTLAALTLASLTAFAFGCSKDDAGSAPAAQVDDSNVNLPPIPPLPLLDIPREYPDGSLSVMGLTIARDANMAKKVRASGLVVERYECDEAASARGRSNPSVEGCLYPHFYLADAPSSSRRILVTGYDSSYESQLLENTRYTISGLYTVQASGFQASEWGIIVPDKIEGSGISQPD